ncbi:MAG TPA: hypothetical protein VLX91_01150 [Candidatus Acidoferrales bacterium]|nr:hypothetical protein [Candidatus Acidoferrales bacterium]
MKYRAIRTSEGSMSGKKPIFLFIAAFLCLGTFEVSFAQQVKWLSVSDLLSPINNIGMNYEGEYGALTQGNFGNSFTWPAQFGYGFNDQDMLRMEGMWIGVKDYNDPLLGKLLSPKVVGSGPRDGADRTNQIFPVQFKLIGKEPHPNVTVINGGNVADGSFQTAYDQVDQYDPTMAPDRMIIVQFNTSVGITVTRKVMVFGDNTDGQYFINDWTFKNTGIYDAAGDVNAQTLDTVWVYFIYRYAFAGEGNGAPSEPIGGVQGTGSWASFQSTWGESTLNHDFGDYGVGSQLFNDASSPLYHMRGFYSYYGPDKNRTSLKGSIYDEDWGCPAQNWDGRMCSWKFAGNVTLHADKAVGDTSDDISQPATTWFISSDLDPDIKNYINQYDAVGMADRWTDITEGHSPIPHDSSMIAVVGGATPLQGNYPVGRRNSGGGTSQEQGFGPYASLAPGDSIHIVYAQGGGGISREKNLEVGANWLQYYNGTGTPDLIMPDGSSAPKTLDGANAYKRAWVLTGKDSIIKIYREAMNNYASGYRAPQPPQPPSNFIVSGLGDRINLQWSEEAEKDPHFNGYVIYRSLNTSMNPLARYDKVFECSKNNLPSDVSGNRSWDDDAANDPNPPGRGFDYYYYLQTKDDGTQRDINGNPVGVLYSSLEWTITVLPASLQRPPIPAGPLPFTFSTMKWIAMNSQGTWTTGMKYGRNDSLDVSDWVKYNNVDYVFVHVNSSGVGDSLTSADSTNPAAADTIWRKVNVTGKTWVSGAGYKAYDAVLENGLNYFTPFQISAGLGLDLVRVVPNPYDSRARSYQYGSQPEVQDKISFFGLPAVCKLKIFTERGDLIYTIDHKGTGDEKWYCRTSAGQIVASGIYILAVEEPNGPKIFRKFVIIR